MAGDFGAVGGRTGRARPHPSVDPRILKHLKEAAVKLGGTGLVTYTSSYVDLVLAAESVAGTVALVAGSHTKDFPYYGTEPWDNCLLRIGDEGYTFTGRVQNQSLHLDFDVEAERPEGKIRFKGRMVRASDHKEVDVELEIPVTLSRFPTRDLGEQYNFLELDGAIGMRWTPLDLRGEEGFVLVGGDDVKLSKVRGGCETGILTNLRAPEMAIQYDYVAVARPGDDGYGIIHFTSHALHPDGPLGKILDFYLTRSASAMLTLEDGRLQDGNPHGVISPPQDDATVTLFENEVDLGVAMLRRQMIKTSDRDKRTLYGLREIFVAKGEHRRTFHLNATQVNAFLAALVLLDVVLAVMALGYPEKWFRDFYDLPYTDPGAMLRRVGAVWVAFALLQLIALLRWRKEPYWLPLIAGVRLTELFSDWTVIAFAEKLTTFGKLGLLIAPPANLVFGLILISTYRRMQKGEVAEGSFFAMPWS